MSSVRFLARGKPFPSLPVRSLSSHASPSVSQTTLPPAAQKLSGKIFLERRVLPPPVSHPRLKGRRTRSFGWKSVPWALEPRLAFARGNVPSSRGSSASRTPPPQTCKQADLKLCQPKSKPHRIKSGRPPPAPSHYTKATVSFYPKGLEGWPGAYWPLLLPLRGPATPSRQGLRLGRRGPSLPSNPASLVPPGLANSPLCGHLASPRPCTCRCVSGAHCLSRGDSLPRDDSSRHREADDANDRDLAPLPPSELVCRNRCPETPQPEQAASGAHPGRLATEFDRRRGPPRSLLFLSRPAHFTLLECSLSAPLSGYCGVSSNSTISQPHALHCPQNRPLRFIQDLQRTDSEIRLPELGSWFCHLLAVGLG